ncbi:M20/M25/M40 family metallo-hydrolase [Gallibacter intestinalis]|uniref:M20/M25/M40 family metallo-hydrolase n=1 Tax=Gallibacter intestinalis TaxID=2779356 RepID=A0ABR9QZ44_9FIRM|nr:M20/M25/M40 family metallo-hydrolase [Gallibacter intestinalis]MBE5035860.1 M20/M25/M40 family metallo-hydrolase [Gallibacter intestinalis]
MIFTEKIKKPVAMTMAAAVCTLLMASSASAMADTGAANVYKAADAASLKQHVTALSEDIGVRLMGTPNEYAAAEYIEGQLDSYGYDGQISEYTINASAVAAIDIGEKQHYANYYYAGEMNQIINPNISNCTLSEPTQEDLDVISTWNISAGDLVVVNSSLFSDLEALSKVQAETDGTETALKSSDFINQAVDKAEEANASAIVIYNDTGLRSQSVKVSGNTIPVIGANTVIGEELISNAGNISISKVERPISWNVEAVKEASTEEPESIIYVTSHLDSVMGAPGATDNASAVAAVLELAKQYKDVDTGGVEIHFVAFGGEEAGLLGSAAFVSQIPEEDKAIAINFNMDMLSSTGTFYGEELNAVSLDIAGGKSATFNIAAALIITGSEDMQFIEGTENLRWFKYGSSDHQSFQDSGIDAASMIRVTDKSDDIEDINHTYKDNMVDNYSLDRHVECTNMVSKGIAKAIDSKFTKVLEYYEDAENGKVVAADTEQLSYLYDEIVYVFEKADGTITQTTGYAANDYAVIAPADATLVSAQGVGTGTANIAGTFDKPKTEQYSTSMVVKEVAAPESSDTNFVDTGTNVTVEFTNPLPEGSQITVEFKDVNNDAYEGIDNLLAVVDISALKDGNIIPISDNLMEIQIPLSEEMKGYKYYQVAYLENGQIVEKINATVKGDILVFVTDHLSEYAILGSNTPFVDDETDQTTLAKATNANSSSTDNQTDTSTNTPITGDSTDVMALMLLMTVAGVTMVAAGVKKKSN